jgi:hypothetical protein
MSQEAMATEAIGFANLEADVVSLIMVFFLRWQWHSELVREVGASLPVSYVFSYGHLD